MRKIVIICAVLCAIAPSTAFAAWWNPLSWGIWRGAGAGTSGGSSLALPSTADLYQRIAELERKLQDAETALAALKQAQSASSAQSARSAASSDALSASPASVGTVSAASLAQARTKFAGAIVRVDTATSSGSGVIIDSSGDILVSANVVLSKQNGTAVAYAPTVTVTLSDGSKQSASTVGFDESGDAAIVRLDSGRSPSYLRADISAQLLTGDIVYIASYPTSLADDTAGHGLVAGKVSSISGYTVEALTNDRPIDNGGAMISASGIVVGVPHIASCKVLEDMKNCLTYAVDATTYRLELQKLVAGMKLYVNKQNRTADESLVNGALTSMHDAIAQGSAIDYAVRNVTGDNSFDAFNSRLADDSDGRVTRVYLSKLKLAASSIEQAMEFLRDQAHSLSLFFINESVVVGRLEPYQQSIAAKLAADAVAREQDYTAQVEKWSEKEHEYDGYLADTSKSSHNYLMLEAITVENAADYLTAQKQAVLDTYSGENVNVF